MARVLITGAAGFAGRHLAEECADGGDAVVGLGSRSAAEAHPPAGLEDYLAADLTDPAAAREAVRATAPARVYHLAARASVARSWDDPAVTINANVASTLNLLEAVRAECPEARVLITCSGEQYGPVPPERLPVTEAEPFRPQSPYGAGKAAADLLGGLYADGYGLHVLRTRSFNHTGPGQSTTYVVSAFARQIAVAEAQGLREVEVATGSLEPRRDFSDVRDVVRAYRLALEQAPPGAYNVCSGRSVAMADILAALGRLTALEVRQRTDPKLLRSHEVMEIRGSHDRLTQATGWEPEIPLERTLAETLDWWRAGLAAGEGAL